MQFGIHIIINHLTLSPVEVGRAVEERGFDSLFVGEHTGCSALAMDPANSRKLFSGMW